MKIYQPAQKYFIILQRKSLKSPDMKLFWLPVILIMCCHQNHSAQHVLIDTSAGDIEVELYPLKAPATVSAFLKSVDEGIYKNGAFYRVLKAEELPTDNNSGILQGGVYNKGDI